MAPRRARLGGRFRVLLSLLALTACTQPATTIVELPEQQDAKPSLDDLLAQLDTVPAMTDIPYTEIPYDRKSFGDGWMDLDGDGCSTRDELLAAELEDPAIATNGCTVLSGILHDPYTGTTSRVDAIHDVEIDHIVSLAEAWYRGASAWSEEDRVLFANDPRNLVSTSTDVNQDKSGKGILSWAPTDLAGECYYIERIVDVKAAFQLGLYDDERALIIDRLTECL